MLSRLRRILRPWSSRRHATSPRSATLRLERLEDRTLPSASGGLEMVPFAVPSAGGPNGPFTPAQIHQAYGFDRIAFGSVAGDGSGQTIAVIDAYDDPAILADANAFSAEFGLPQFNVGGPTLVKVGQDGGSALPATSSTGGWQLEAALDVEWAHAMAPGANIVLVEASSNSNADLFAAVRSAAGLPGVSVVGMSFGTTEGASLASFDATFAAPAGHAGVTFVASAGDDGTVNYPASSPGVLAVGGTTLTMNASGGYGSESGWVDSGGGVSSFEAEPSYQRAVQNTGKRAGPDVAYNANPTSGYWVYDSSASGGPWVVAGGTSAGVPQWAALIAIADQGRALQGLSSLDGATQTLPMLYSLPASDFHDVTTGGSSTHSAAAGFDLTTGLGSPFADRIAAALAGVAPGTATIAAVSSSLPPATAAPAVSPPPAPPSPFDEIAADALFMARAWRAGDFAAVLSGFAQFQSLYYQSPAYLRPQLLGAMRFDLASDLF